MIRQLLPDGERWREVFRAMGRNRLRTALTAFGIFWGIFMLIILIGVGNGLENGVLDLFRDDALNSVWIRAGKTSQPWLGFQAGREITLGTGDFYTLRSQLDGMDAITPRNQLGGSFTVNYGGQEGNYDVCGTFPEYQIMEQCLMVDGRFLNEADLTENRAVAVIGEIPAVQLFGGENPIGKTLTIKGFPFKVVGVFTDAGPEREIMRIFIPFFNFQQTFGYGRRVERIILTTKEGVTAEYIEQQVRNLIGRRQYFNPADRTAIRVYGPMLEARKYLDMFASIRMFVWVVGLATLAIGIVGVSNILLVTVRERTREIGIRKALGATPWWVISLILQEALAITFVFGYMGLAAGVAVLELIRNSLATADSQLQLFKNPGIDLKIGLWALAALVISGLLAGFAPALRAARVQPVVALRDE